MKNLSYLLKISKIMKKLMLPMMLIGLFLPVMSQAAAGAATCRDSLADQFATLGDQYIPGPTIADLGSVGGNALTEKTRYHQLIIPADGNISINFFNTSNKTITFSIGSSCDSTSSYTSNVTGGNSTGLINLINVTKNQVIYVKINTTATNSLNYYIHINYTSPVILAQISPATINVPEGYSTVDLNVTLNRGAVNGDLNVSYLNTYDNSTHYFIIDKWYDQYTLTVDINTSDPSLVLGADFNITLLSATVLPDPETPGSSSSETALINENNDTSTIIIGTPLADMAIVKGDSSDRVRMGTSFYYTLAISNRGTAPATSVTVTDVMPDTLKNNVDSIVTKTNGSTDTTSWICSQVNATITCLHNGDFPVNQTKIIEIHVIVPLNDALLGYVYNDASVFSPQNYDIRNDSDSESTKIVVADYDEIGEVGEICYNDTTLTTMGEDYTDAYIARNCKKIGNFYYGNGCTATVDIIADTNLSSVVTNIELTKMYAPQIVNGNCGAEQGTCAGPVDINIEESPSFTNGYIFNIGTMTSDANLTISDTDSYDGNPNNPAELDGIGIYATYEYQGVVHFGRVSNCAGIPDSGIAITTSADAIDTPLFSNDTLAAQYNASMNTSSNGLKWIQTMSAATPSREIAGVHLDISSKQATQYVFEGDPRYYSDYRIIPYVVDGTEDNQCSLDNQELLYDSTGNELVISVPEFNYSGSKNIIVPRMLRKNARLQLIIVDPNLLSEEGQSCLSQSSTGGNLEGIGQCGNSEIQYVDGFGVDSWDRCGINNGSPCLPQHGGYSGGGDESYPGYNKLYDNPLGCYMCTFNIKPACSTDNFAIRPDRFNANIVETNTPTHYPNLLRSGQDYNNSLTAVDTDGAVSASYTVLDFHNIVTALTPPKKYFNGTAVPWVEDTSGLLLHGIAVATPISPSYMVEGQSRLTNTVGIAEPVVGVTFDDVGRVSIYIEDTNWSQVDNDDTPMDCNSSEHTYICGELNATFIPHHFGFAELNISNQSGPDSNFTYIADNRGMPSTTPPTRSPMAARVHTRIEARNKQDGVTQNFREDFGGNLYYENNISVTQTVSIPIARSLPAEPNAYVFGADANESTVDNKLIGFGRTTGPETDAPGTRNVRWNESTYPIEFNFHRELNKPANPFDVNGTYYSISTTSTYTDPDDGDTAIIDGSRIGDANASVSPCVAPPAGTCVNANAESNATFYYGRARPTQTMYDDVSTSSVTTPIAIDVYCDLLFSECDTFGINTTNAKTNEVDWWLSLNHVENTIQHDGNITLDTAATADVRSNNTGTQNPAEVRIVSEGIDKNVVVTATSSTRPLTIDIELVHNILPLTLPNYTATPPYTNSWLIYNKDANEIPSPFYRVRFIGTSGWAGHGDTGHVVDSNVSTKKNRRLGW